MYLQVNLEVNARCLGQQSLETNMAAWLYLRETRYTSLPNRPMKGYKTAIWANASDLDPRASGVIMRVPADSNY
jgi:hypothetical protein